MDPHQNRAAPDPALDVADVIDRATITPFHVRVFALCLLAMTVDGFDMQVLPFTAPVMLKSLGVSPSMLGPLVSSAIFGMLVSGLVGGVLSDRVGRRAVILGGLLTFGIFTIAKGTVRTYGELLVLQFVTGIGLGGTFTNVLALAAEYSPLRNRRFIVTLVSAAFPLGSIISGHVTAHLMAEIGWNGVFIVGGLLALAVLALAAAGLPGSVRQMVLKESVPGRVTAIMAQVAPCYTADTRWVTSEEPSHGFPLREVFSGGRASVTILLGASMALSLMAGYFVTSYSPLLFNLAGITPARAAVAASMLHVGAVVGSLLWGELTDRYWPPLILGSAACVAVVCYAFIGHLTGDYGILLVVLLIGGLGMGVQNAFNGFASSLYPTAMRGTALGVIIGLGRLGSIAGPLVGGALLAASWPVPLLYHLAATVAAGMVLCMILISIIAAPRQIVRAAGISRPERRAGAAARRQTFGPTKDP